MKRNIVVLAAALLACGQSANGPLTAEEARAALPSSAQAQIATPGGATAVAGPSTLVAAAGVTADYAQDTIAFASAVNGSVIWTLGLLEAVVSWPPTACAGDTCTWGPGSGTFDVNVYQLQVTKVADADYTWKLEAYPKSDPTMTFITFISGEAFTTPVKNVGHGTLLVDMNAAQKLAHLSGQPAQVGTIDVQYDNRSGASLSAQFLGTQDSVNPSQTVNAGYQFLATAGGGDLQLAVENMTTQAVLLLHSRWTSSGAGRGDASFSQGTNSVARSECWDSDASVPPFELLYQVTTPADPSDSGDVSSCGSFTTAVPPTIAVPQG